MKNDWVGSVKFLFLQRCLRTPIYQFPTHTQTPISCTSRSPKALDTPDGPLQGPLESLTYLLKICKAQAGKEWATCCEPILDKVASLSAEPGQVTILRLFYPAWGGNVCALRSNLAKKLQRSCFGTFLNTKKYSIIYPHIKPITYKDKRAVFIQPISEVFGLLWRRALKYLWRVRNSHFVFKCHSFL